MIFLFFPFNIIAYNMNKVKKAPVIIYIKHQNEEKYDLSDFVQAVLCTTVSRVYTVHGEKSI